MNAAQPPGPHLDPDAAVVVAEYLFDRGWTDGLPVLPATEAAVARFLLETSRDPDSVVASMPQLHREATVRDVAVHAIMAGCLPEYFPVVLAAWDALSAEGPVKDAGWQSTSGPAPFVIVNGPARENLGINSAGGVFGPGFRPNATIPRAIGLTVRNSLGVIPHELEQATQGVPGRWTSCIAEAEEDSPWEPLSVEGGLEPGVSAVSSMLVRTCEFVDNRHFRSHEDVLRDFAETINRTGTWIFRHPAVGIVMNPEHAWLFAEVGMSKQDVRQWLFDHCGHTEAEMEAVGKGLSHLVAEPYPPDHWHPLFADASHRSLPIIVAGSRNAAISMVFRVFRTWSGTSFPVD